LQPLSHPPVSDDETNYNENDASAAVVSVMDNVLLQNDLNLTKEQVSLPSRPIDDKEINSHIDENASAAVRDSNRMPTCPQRMKIFSLKVY